jgi:asparagine synthase (glutamine-hydrolysing)
MTDALGHRGPDGQAVMADGRIAFGHRRLSILDTSSAGAQPMTSADGRYTIVHNGEIYNFLELADTLSRRGARLRTRTDTEVILEAFAAWGPGCLAEFNGIWAFAIWDRETQTLHLSRDRLGVKPLFIAEGDGYLGFASEIKALLELPWVDREPEPGAIRDFLLDGRVDHTEHTFFRGVRRLPSAAHAAFQGSSRTVRRYWRPPALSRDATLRGAPSDAGQVEQLRSLVIESVSLQLRSDVAVGSCLSGGLDSSGIVTVADALRRGRLASGLVHHDRDRHPQMAFFAAFEDPEVDERRYVDAVVRQTGVDLHSTTPGSLEFLKTIVDVVRQQDEPFGSSSIFAQYEVMRLAQAWGVKVLLDGQGADELLAGYPPSAAARYGGALRTRDALAVAVGLARRRLAVSAPRALWYAVTGGALPPSWLRPSRVLRPWLGASVQRAERLPMDFTDLPGTPLARTLWRDLQSTHLPGLLRFEDRASMRFGIEARVPFLDHRIVEVCLAMPDRLKVSDGIHKVALRRALEGVVPSIVSQRRDKVGFATPEDRWLRETAVEIEAVITNSSVEGAGLLRQGATAWLLRGWRSGRVPREVLWRVISLELWHRVVVRGQRDLFSAVKLSAPYERAPSTSPRSAAQALANERRS